MARPALPDAGNGATRQSAAEIRLWSGAAPGSERSTHQEVSFVDGDGDLKIRNVVVPTLTPVLPDPAVRNGTAMVIAPGGGFFMLSWGAEGTLAADWLCARGVTCFVLKYRVVDTGPTQEDFAAYLADIAARWTTLSHQFDQSPSWSESVARGGADGLRAMEVVRSGAAEWNVRPDRIGFLGFSAGAYVATHVAAAPPGARPDFLATIYGGSAQLPVAADAPPLFSLVAADDPLCYTACMSTFQAWRAAGRPAELHVYAEGGHGFGMNQRGLPIDTWIERLGDWMGSRALLAS